MIRKNRLVLVNISSCTLELQFKYHPEVICVLQDSTASQARSLLQGTVADIGARYAQGKPGECGPLHNPLGMGELTPFLPLPRTLFAGVGI
jgi:hypothetical protein